jgi:hypothetical protein
MNLPLTSPPNKLGRFSFSAALCFASLALRFSAHAAPYTATFINPAGITHAGALCISGEFQVGVGRGPLTNGNSRAFLWKGSAASAVDLTPPGFAVAGANAASGMSQVGAASLSINDSAHAMLWHGTAESAVDLNPDGFQGSVATAISGTSQVGHGVAEGNSFGSHALLWHGTAESVVDLNPEGFDTSEAHGISTNTQVGSGGGPITGGRAHALLWNGSAASAVDLHPPGFESTFAMGVSGSSQVGYGFGTATNQRNHALLWTGSAASVVDLHPPQFNWSEAYATRGDIQVGRANDRAILWKGSAERFIDLQQFVTAVHNQYSSSIAVAIGDDGTIVGYAERPSSPGGVVAVIWTPVPESSVLGDYNNNSQVDAADYVVWRKGDKNLFNEIATIGSNTAQDYTEWRKRFGNPPASGTETAISIPEPSTLALLATLLVALLAIKRAP